VTGDWVHVDGVAAGQVKQIDLKSTTPIGFDRVPQYNPNADLANTTVQNLSRRDHRRISRVVPIVLSATVAQVGTSLAYPTRSLHFAPALDKMRPAGPPKDLDVSIFGFA
jgi:Mechanosensitive ion channel, beta-domain